MPSRSHTIRPGMAPLWMLNDGSTTDSKTAYMRACLAGGIDSLVLHPRTGGLLPYLSSDWFAMIRALVVEGRRLGMHLWLYDEDPCPTGGAGGLVMIQRPDLRARRIGYHEAPASLKPGEVWSIGESNVLWAGLVPVTRPAPARDLTAGVGVRRTDWFMTRWDSRWYYPDTPTFDCPRATALRVQTCLRAPAVPRDHKLIALTADSVEATGCWGSMPDMLHRDIFAAFRASTLDPYVRAVGRYFGTTIPGVFTDEEKPHGGRPYTDEMFADFRARFGYDLRPRLYQLFGKPLCEAYELTRIDYRRWSRDRFLDGFLRPYRRWCDAHGLHLAGHLSPEDDPVNEATNVGSVMGTMSVQTCAGTDVIVPYTGSKRAPALNLGSVRAASVKRQQNQACATSETLALTGWSVTSALCRQLLAWQKVLGIDRFFPHSFMNTSEGVTVYEAPPDYGPYTPVFAGICALNRWLKDVDRLTDGATDHPAVAILNSMTSYYAMDVDPDPDRVRKLRHRIWQTLLACLRAHVAVEFVNEDDLPASRVQAGRIHVGERAYADILVPAMDFLPTAVFRKLEEAARRGTNVTWLGGGPRRTVRRSGFTPAAIRQGCIVKPDVPSAAWCRRHLRPAARLTGRDREDCYIRRFTARDGQTYLLAANVGESPLSLSLAPDTPGGPSWHPVEADGDVAPRKAATHWKLPAQGAGLFVQRDGPVARPTRVLHSRPAALEARTFHRVRPNLMRLEHPTVRRGGKTLGPLEHPQPYWELFTDYSTDRAIHSFPGDIPVEGSVPPCDVTYVFPFAVKGNVPAPRLLIDPRCARGRFAVILNGTPLGRQRRAPVARSRPLSLPLSKLRSGKNVIALRFRVTHPMDGLLTQLYIEGDFDVDTRGATPTLRPASGNVSTDGWQAGGMPHYMGRGIYRWEETFTPGDLDLDWTLALDGIVDSAELRVNGSSAGTRAWAPWQWSIRGLRPGVNKFELRVDGTAGNKHELDRRETPQGWIGGGVLRATPRENAT